jgi:hypothetical protein
MGGTPPTPMATSIDMTWSPPFFMGGRLSLWRHALTLLGLFIFMGDSLQALQFATQVGMSPVFMGAAILLQRLLSCGVQCPWPA